MNQENTWKNMPLNIRLVEVTIKVLRRDISIGTADYNRMLENMSQLIIEINDSGGADPSKSIAGSTALQGATIKNILVNYRQFPNWWGPPGVLWKPPRIP
jgi:hypothetical protein